MPGTKIQVRALFAEKGFYKRPARAAARAEKADSNAEKERKYFETPPKNVKNTREKARLFISICYCFLLGALL